MTMRQYAGIANRSKGFHFQRRKKHIFCNLHFKINGLTNGIGETEIFLATLKLVYTLYPNLWEKNISASENVYLPHKKKYITFYPDIP